MSRLRLENKNIVVTGATGGMGAAIARRCVAEGANVVLGYSVRVENHKDSLDKIFNDCREHRRKVEAVDFDLREYESLRTLVVRAEEKLGKIDGIVHCAAIFGLHPLGSRTEALARSYFDQNALATFALLEAGAELLADNGRMIVFSSTGARLTAKGAALYSASKAATEAMARGFALELGERGICVNSIAPGPTDTPMLHKDFREIAASRSPLGRLGSVKDHAGLVVFLLSEEGGWITGQTIFSNGGYFML